MDTNEDYLDNLLQSMLAEEGGEDDTAQKSLIDTSEAESTDNDSIDLDALLSSLEGIEGEMEETQEPGEEIPETDIFAADSEDENLEEWQPEDNVETEESPEESVDLEETGSVEEELPEDADEPKMLSPEEIEAMFAEMDQEEAMESENDMAEEIVSEDDSEESDADGGGEEDDLLAMLESMESDNSDLNEINSLLEKSDNNEMVEEDMLALLDDTSDQEDVTESVSGIDNQTDEGGWYGMEAAGTEENGQENGKKKRKKKEKKERKKKEKAPKEKSAKGGLFSKLLNLISEEEELLAEGGTEQAQDADAAVPEKKKKEKKPKKEKKAKTEKVKKEKKEKKPKKEKVKKEKAPKVPEPKGRPLPKKKLASVILFAATVFAAVLLFTDFIPEIMENIQAKEAFEQADYERVYELLVCKERKKSEEKLYQSALLIEQLERSMESYLNYEKMGMDIQALDALVKGVGKYEAISEAAVEYGVQDKVDEVYESILITLESAYGVSKEQALDMLAAKDDVYYTLALKQALGMETPENILGIVSETVEGETAEEDAERVSEETVMPEDMLDAEMDMLDE